MPLRLKLKVNSSKAAKIKSEPDAAETRALPKFRIKQPSASKDDMSGVTKPKAPKEKVKKLKLSLGKASSTPAAANESTRGPRGQVQPVVKKVPKVRIKPTRVPGEGYDSEAPDIEDDPLLEQAIAVRFLNDANLDFLHSAADTGDFSNVNIKWITRDKAVVNVNLTLYSARLIDMPTLTELYKTVDKKNIFKTIDVSQILLVLRMINPKNLNMETDFEVPEEHTYTHPLYKLSVNKEIRSTRTAYRHGFSNSFEDVYRRFRPKKVNHRLMTDIELHVDEIVRRDNDAQESHYEYVNPKLQLHRFGDGRRAEQVSKGLSAGPHIPNINSSPGTIASAAERETDDPEDNESDQMALDIEADLDIALEQELAEALESTSNTTAATVLMKSEYINEEEDGDDVDESNVVGAISNVEGEDEEDEDDEDDDEDEDEDEDGKQDKSKVKKLEEEIADLQKAAEKQKVLLATASYKMMRMKFQSAYNNLKSQLDLKKRELAKIREQQSKCQQHIPAHAENCTSRTGGLEEEDEDEDDVEDDADEDEAMADQGQVEDADGEETTLENQESFKGGSGEQRQQEEEDADMDDATDEDNYDDFQGLF